MATYKKVEALGRGLSLLSIIAQNPGRSIADICDLCKLNRTTVYRMLNTLETLGYVRRRAADGGYFVTHITEQLAGVSSENTRLLDAASPCLLALNAEIEWPASVITAERDRMIIADTTHGRSKVFVHQAGIGTNVPTLTSAAGRAYLSDCGEQERQVLLSSSKVTGANGKQDSLLDKIIASTKANGFALAIGEAKKQIGGLAMAIHQGDKAVASINIVFLAACINRQTVIRRYLPLLRKTVEDIECQLASR
jgi:IclR family mhp operon transcriptional activator